MTITDEQLKEIQGIILNILKAIDKVCLEHGITYYMIAGTQLGAVRHKGFVPWDDDADIAMPRPDYERFIAHANEWLPEYYRLVDGKSDDKYPYAFARVHDIRTTYLPVRMFTHYTGVPVDIFPLDGMIEDGPRRRLHYLRYKRKVRRLYNQTIDPYKHGPGFRALYRKLIQKYTSRSKSHAKIDARQQEFDYHKCRLIADHDNKPFRGIYPKEVFGTPQRMDFCDTQLNGVQDPDTYLRISYGDYMKPVKPDHLNFRELDLHKPYLERERELEEEKKREKSERKKKKKKF